MGKSALVLGATGVVGRELVRELCESPGYDEVEAWARRINLTKFFARLARR